MPSIRNTTAKPTGAEPSFKTRITRFDPKYQRLILSVRRVLRRRFSTANELVYDYANAFVFSYSPTERGSDAVVAVSAGSDGIRLVFNQGPTLPDPKKLLRGSGRQTRFIWIESPGTVTLPEVEALLRAAAGKMKTPLARSGRGEQILKESSAKRPARDQGLKRKERKGR